MATYKPILDEGLIIRKGTVSDRQLAQKEEAIADLQYNYPIVVPFVPVNLPQ